MKRIWLVLMVLLSLNSIGGEEKIEWRKLLYAISYKESGCRDHVTNSLGATGRYQIRQIYLDDVNLNYNTSYHIKDMHNPVLATWVVLAYLKMYKPKTNEEAARIHNGGPRGYSKSSTKKYWLDIRYLMAQYPY